MSHCVISAKYPPQIDVTRTPLAYGSGALPRLVCIYFIKFKKEKNNHIHFSEQRT